MKKEMIATLAEKYPNFSKITACMISHPERYGVGLTKEAQQYLYTAYPELKPPQKRKKPNRKKDRRIVFYVDDDEMTAVKTAAEGSGCKTMQEYLAKLMGNKAECKMVFIRDESLMPSDWTYCCSACRRRITSRPMQDLAYCPYCGSKVTGWTDDIKEDWEQS